MEDLDKKIIELMDLFDGEVTTLDKINPPESRKDVQDIEAINRFMRDNPPGKADGGRIDLKRGTDGPGKSAFRKPFSPEIEKQIIKLHQVDKLGAQAIADKLGLSRSPVGKRITALKKEGIIKDIPVSERKASIDMRGDFFGKAPGEKYLAVREIRDIDRKTIDRSTGRLKFKIPKGAKYKVDFKSTGANLADVSNVPEKFRGVQYFKTKEAAEKAVADRKKLKLIEDVDSDEVRKKANKKKYDLVEEVSNNNIERILADFKKGQPIEKAHRLSLNQVRKTGEIYNVMNLGLDFDDPNYVQINNEAVKPYENKLKQLYAEQNKLYKQAKDLKEIPQDLRKKIEFNNKKISAVVDLAGGRVQGLQLDEFTLKPKVYGVNYANVLGFGLYDKPVAQLTKDDRAAIGAIMQSQVENEIKTAGKTAQNLIENKKFLKDVDILATNNPELFKTAGVSTQQTFTKIDNVKGLVPFMKKLGIKCQLSEGINCMNPKAYERSLNQISKAAKAGDTAAASKMANFTKAVRGAGSVIKGVLGPAALAYEVAFAVPIGLFEYAQGKPAEEIVNTLTYGLGGKSREDRLKEEMPTYGQGDALQSAFDGYLSTLNRLGEERDPNQLRPGKKADDMLKTFYERQEPFMRVNPQVEQGQMFDLDMFRKNVAESRAAEEKLAEEDLKRKQERRTDPFTAYSDDFMAAGGGRAGFTGGGYGKDAAKYIKEIETDHHKGYQYYKKHGGKKSFKQYMKESMSKYFAGGGIAKEAGDPSGAPPESGPNSQGLQGLLNRVKNT